MAVHVIEAQGLGKRYLLGDDVSGRRLMQTLFPWRKNDAADEFWALRDVSFAVDAGEAIGVIGRNGAGKSTLLKLLSRITAPTEGRARLRGRLGTLLEVGTGFHPDLSGRDNIFLSGTILGMKHGEVARKFDQIVDFAGIEKFIETPVKRYSSGMYVRLAFAVASFLEPDILIVDEVLAVGDANFQRKSLGKLNQAAGQEGRTILFVSHHLQAIRSFCHRVLLLEGGRIVFDGPVDEGISRYLRSIPTHVDVRGAALKDRLNRTSGAVRFTEVTAVNGAGTGTWQHREGDTVRLRFGYEVHDPVPGFAIHLQLRSAIDDRIITVMREPAIVDSVERGRVGAIEIELPDLPLRPGEISLYAAFMSIDDTRSYDVVDANVDLPLLIIASDETDKYARQGVVSLDYRVRDVTLAGSAGSPRSPLRA